MSILEALEEIKESIPAIKTFLYADLNEANLEADLLNVTEFPLLIILPLAPVDSIGKAGKAKTTVNLRFFLLDKDTTQQTVEHRASVIETSVIAPMRLLARRYIHRINEHSIIDPEGAGITSATYNPTYSGLDANVHGVEVTAQVPIMEHINVCF